MPSRLSSFFVPFMLILLAGCAGTSPTAPARTAAVTTAGILPDGAMVREIRVDLESVGLPAERLESARKYDLDGRIAGDLQARLQATQSYDSEKGDVVLHINVTRFRLRSGSAAFWLGAMAGADTLAVDVVVERNGRNLDTFATDTSTALGGMVVPAPSQRINRMSKELARRIAARL